MQRGERAAAAQPHGEVLSEHEAVETVARIHAQARGEQVRLTLHAHQEMVAEDFTLEDLLLALRGCRLLEAYPEDRRGLY